MAGESISGIITDIRAASMEGTTFFYVQLNERPPYYASFRAMQYVGWPSMFNSSGKVDS